MKQEKINNRIRKIRETQGITRTDLAKRSNVSYRALETWELGYNKATDVNMLKRVADALGCKIEDIVIFDDEL